LTELIGGEKGEGKQMSAWEKIYDELSKITAEAGELEITNDLVLRGQEIVKFVKTKKCVLPPYLPPLSLVARTHASTRTRTRTLAHPSLTIMDATGTA
jgi:hypothetical protein